MGNGLSSPPAGFRVASPPPPPMVVDLDAILGSPSSADADTIRTFKNWALWTIAHQGGPNKSAEDLAQAKSIMGKIQAWATRLPADAPPPLRQLAKEVLAACPGLATPGSGVAWLPPLMQCNTAAPATPTSGVVPATVFQNPNGHLPDGNAPTSLEQLWHPAPGSDTIGFNPLAPRPAPKPLPQRTDFEKTNPTAHGYKAIRDGNDEVIGYARSSAGYTEIRDIEGKIVHSSEIPITSDLLSPIDLLTLPFGGLAKLGVEAAGEELVAVAARWGVKEAVDATGEAAAKVLAQTTAKLTTTRGALAAAGAAYTLYDYFASDGGNPAEIQAILGNALADMIPQDVVTGATLAAMPGGGGTRTGAVAPAQPNKISPSVTAHNIWEFARQFPPDVAVLGTVLSLPGGQKLGVYLLQPLNANINKGSYWTKEFKEHPLNVIDWSKPPTLYLSGVPKNWVRVPMAWAGTSYATVTYNFANNMIEGGYGKSISLPFNNTFFWNVRGGVSTTTLGTENASLNCGLMNASVLPGMVKLGVAAGAYVASIARTTEAAAVADAPETGGATAIAGAAIPVAKNVLLQMLKTARWNVGFGWRSGELTHYPNGETDLNFSGGKVRLVQGEGPGGSGLPSSAFIVDFAQPSEHREGGGAPPPAH